VQLSAEWKLCLGGRETWTDVRTVYNASEITGALGSEVIR
jgi:hypothetical protein